MISIIVVNQFLKRLFLHYSKVFTSFFLFPIYLLNIIFNIIWKWILFLWPWLHRIWNIKFKLKFPYHTYMSVCNQIQIVHLIRWFFYFFSIFYYAILITLNLQLSLKQDLKVMPKQFWLGQGVPKNAPFLTALLYV